MSAILPAALSAQQAITQQNVALSVVKSSADAEKAIANILTEASQNVPTGSGRGSVVNITA